MKGASVGLGPRREGKRRLNFAPEGDLSRRGGGAGQLGGGLSSFTAVAGHCHSPAHTHTPQHTRVHEPRHCSSSCFSSLARCLAFISSSVTCTPAGCWAGHRALLDLEPVRWVRGGEPECSRRRFRLICVKESPPSFQLTTISLAAARGLREGGCESGKCGGERELLGGGGCKSEWREK